MKGKDKKFYPVKKVSRAELAVITQRLSSKIIYSKNKITTVTQPKDVANDHWGKNAILWSLKNKLIKARDNYFLPDAKVSRAELAVVLKRLNDYIETEKQSKKKNRWGVDPKEQILELITPKYQEKLKTNENHLITWKINKSIASEHRLAIVLSRYGGIPSSGKVIAENLDPNLKKYNWSIDNYLSATSYDIFNKVPTRIKTPLISGYYKLSLVLYNPSVLADIKKNNQKICQDDDYACWYLFAKKHRNDEENLIVIKQQKYSFNILSSEPAVKFEINSRGPKKLTVDDEVVMGITFALPKEMVNQKKCSIVNYGELDFADGNREVVSYTTCKEYQSVIFKHKYKKYGTYKINIYRENGMDPGFRNQIISIYPKNLSYFANIEIVSDNEQAVNVGDTINIKWRSNDLPKGAKIAIISRDFSNLIAEDISPSENHYIWKIPAKIGNRHLISGHDYYITLTAYLPTDCKISDKLCLYSNRVAPPIVASSKIIKISLKKEINCDFDDKECIKRLSYRDKEHFAKDLLKKAIKSRDIEYCEQIKNIYAIKNRYNTTNSYHLACIGNFIGSKLWQNTCDELLSAKRINGLGLIKARCLNSDNVNQLFGGSPAWFRVLLYGDAKTLTWLKELGINPNTLNQKGQTALTAELSYGYSRKTSPIWTKKLLDLGVDQLIPMKAPCYKASCINQYVSETPLILTLKYGHNLTVPVLIADQYPELNSKEVATKLLKDAELC